MRGTLADHVLIRPSARGAVAAAVGRAARERRCVLWLDDLETYLGASGLTPAHAGRLLAGPGHHRVIVATIRAAELDRITAQAEADDEAGRRAASDLRQVLDQAHPIRISRMFTPAEVDRARVRAWDPRIADALGQAGSYGIAEYLAAGPALLQAWENARVSSRGPHARGAALVAAAIDIRRAGWTSVLPRDLLTQAHEHYLTDPEHVRTPSEPLDQAWDWATQQREATTALLRPNSADPGEVEAFDYLIDTIQRRDGPLAQAPEPTIRAAISHATPADANSIAEVAYAQGRYQLAERGLRRALSMQATDPHLGAEHPDTLASRNNLAEVLHDLGRLEDAEAEHRAVLEIRTRILGAEHPDTLASRNYLAEVHSRYFWGLRLHLVCTLHGLPVMFALAGAKADEREVLLGMLENAADIVSGRPGQTLIGDKNYFGRAFEEELHGRAAETPRPSTAPSWRFAPGSWAPSTPTPDQPRQPRLRPARPRAAGRRRSRGRALTKLVLRPDDQPATRAAAAGTAANTAAKPLDNTCPRRAGVECRPSARTATDGPGRRAHSYGSKGLLRQSLTLPRRFRSSVAALPAVRVGLPLDHQLTVRVAVWVAVHLSTSPFTVDRAGTPVQLEPLDDCAPSC